MAVRLFGGDHLFTSVKNDGTLNLSGRYDFFTPGTTTPKAVYADRLLASPLGSSVTVDAAARKEIWLNGTYKVRALDSLGATLWELDNIPGDDAIQVVTVGSSTTLDSTHHGKLVVVTGVGLTLTLTDGATLGIGWNVNIVTAGGTGTTNIVRSAPGDTINGTAANISLSANENSRMVVSAISPSGAFIEGRSFSPAASYTFTSAQTFDQTVNLNGPLYEEMVTSAAASATLNLGGMDGNDIQITHTTGTVAITSLGSGKAGTLVSARFSVTGSAVLSITHAAALRMPSQRSVNVRDGDRMIARCLGDGTTPESTGANWEVLTYVRGGLLTAGERQCNLSGPSTLVSAGAGLSAVLNASASEPFIFTAMNGRPSVLDADRIGMILANATISSLAPSTTNYLYSDIAANGSVTHGATTLKPIYSYSATPTGYNTSGQFVLNKNTGLATLGNGAGADTIWRVYHGEAVTNGSAVTSVVSYAYGTRFFIEGIARPTGAQAATTVATHNLGVVPHDIRIRMRCTAIGGDGGYAQGDTVEIGDGRDMDATANGAYRNFLLTEKILQLAASVATFHLCRKDTGVTFSSANGSWVFDISLDRGW